MYSLNLDPLLYKIGRSKLLREPLSLRALVAEKKPLVPQRCEVAKLHELKFTELYSKPNLNNSLINSH